MGCFIKKIWEGNAEGAHQYFIRFSKGKFETRAVLNLQKTTKIKLRGSFEWANDFAKIAAELTELNFSGIISSKQEIPEIAQFLSKKKEGIVQYEVENLTSETIKKIQDRAYCMLLDAANSEIILKMKKKLPKPGKSGEGKVDDKFCQLEADLKYWNQIKDSFMFPECKKCRINHTFIIEDIILPQGEKDFAKIRELAQRKGKIIRKIEVDKVNKQEEKEFIA
jgi:hypothetical protein